MDSQLNSYLGQIISGTFFVVIALTAFTVSLIRRDKNARTLFWLGMWSGSYGIRLLILCPPVNISFPSWLQLLVPWIDVTANYFILVFALLTWLDFTRYGIRLFLKIMSILSIFIALAGIAGFIFYEDSYFFVSYNQLAATVTLLVLIVVLCVKPLADRFLVLPHRGLLAVATLFFAAEALYTNIARFLDWPKLDITGWLGFAVLLFALALSALRIIFENEKKLLTIQTELATARKIQFSILPLSFPQNDKLQVAAAYYPMNAVAGDFYDYLLIDENHYGFLVADVSGHGVPAALIASMVKVAIQSAGAMADDPAKILKQLARVIAPQMHSQFITAAYLFIDLQKNKARYSAAGHPPLLYSSVKTQQFAAIESNGLLISAIAMDDYPVAEWDIQNGDRFMLYTDGLSEAENRFGEMFADTQFNQLLNGSKNQSAAELSNTLYTALQKWLENPGAQQDDFSWIIIDITC